MDDLIHVNSSPVDTDSILCHARDSFSRESRAGQIRICGRRRLDGIATPSRRRPDGIRLDGVRKNLRKFGKNCLRRGTDGIRRC